MKLWIVDLGLLVVDCVWTIDCGLVVHHHEVRIVKHHQVWILISSEYCVMDQAEVCIQRKESCRCNLVGM